MENIKFWILTLFLNLSVIFPGKKVSFP